MLQPIRREDANALMAQQVIVDLKSLVKELLDNALDAGAGLVRIHVIGASVDALEVIDNGTGIPACYLSQLGVKGCTSKISQFEDITTLCSKGFRVRSN